MTYEKSISSNEPGLVTLLIDRSTSMEQKIGGIKGTVPKSVCVAQNVNRVLTEMCLRNTKEIGGRPVIKPRIEVCLIGYGGDADDPNSVKFAFEGPLSSREIVTLPELSTNYKKLETYTTPGTDDNFQMPVWIEPRADGKTPMGLAFRCAANVIDKWASRHKTSFPPILLNFTDGEANDVTAIELKTIAQELKQIQTVDGNLLLFNCHIASKASRPCMLPSSLEEIPRSNAARLMFEISSVLPPAMQQLARNRGFKNITDQARGFAYNADSANFVHFLQIGTVGLTEIFRG